MTSSAAFIGIDWGTTNRRAWLLDAQGEVIATQRDDMGSLVCRGNFPMALNKLLARWPGVGQVPVVMAGMVGSALGWQEVPYVGASLPLAELPRHLAPVAGAPAGARWFIVPGMAWHGPEGRADVMRGEETQLLGALALAPEDAWVVLPGTHSKWVQQRAGTVAVLRTYMTGELFAALRDRGTLSPLMAAEAGADERDAAFDAGVRALGQEELSHALFGARARVMAGGAPAVGSADYVSGLLMAAEWRDATRCGLDAAHTVRLVGEPALCARHARCGQHFGLSSQILNPELVQRAAWRAFLQHLTDAP